MIKGFSLKRTKQFFFERWESNFKLCCLKAVQILWNKQNYVFVHMF